MYSVVKSEKFLVLKPISFHYPHLRLSYSKYCRPALDRVTIQLIVYYYEINETF